MRRLEDNIKNLAPVAAGNQCGILTNQVIGATINVDITPELHQEKPQQYLEKPVIGGKVADA